VLVDELGGEERRVARHDLHDNSLPGLEVGLREERTDGAGEARLAKHDFVERAHGRFQCVVPHLERHVTEEF